MSGLLKVSGLIDLAQFWPDGESDADTTKIKLKVGPNAFKFAADGETFKTTRVFEGAKSTGQGRKPLIDAKGRITVRLQGIDAPELHYRASALPGDRADVTDAKREAFNAANRAEKRQYWAETATVALCEKLSNFAKGGVVKCEFWSHVDYPHEIADVYGRFVGNIGVGAGFDLDINTWLAEEGWVYPAFYSSMSNDEIEALCEAAERGRKKKRLWAHLQSKVNKFDARLVYRPHGEVDADADVGPVLFPKLFRRQVAHAMEKKAGLKPGTFKAYLKKKLDECFETDDFMENGVHSAVTMALHDFITGQDFAAAPDEVVFKEKPASVVDANNKRIEKF